MSSRDDGASVTGEPAEHARFHEHLSALSEVAAADECNLLATILTDPDQTMAQSAVIRHIDSKAPCFEHDEAYLQWRAHVAIVVGAHRAARARLDEWTLFRAINADSDWSATDLFAASDWLQRKAAGETQSPRALTLLAEHGRTRRIRAAARIRAGEH